MTENLIRSHGSGSAVRDLTFQETADLSATRKGRTSQPQAYRQTEYDRVVPDERRVFAEDVTSNYLVVAFHGVNRSCGRFAVSPNRTWSRLLTPSAYSFPDFVGTSLEIMIVGWLGMGAPRPLLVVGCHQATLCSRIVASSSNRWL